MLVVLESMGSGNEVLVRTSVLGIIVLEGVGRSETAVLIVGSRLVTVLGSSVGKTVGVTGFVVEGKSEAEVSNIEVGSGVVDTSLVNPKSDVAGGVSTGTLSVVSVSEVGRSAVGVVVKEGIDSADVTLSIEESGSEVAGCSVVKGNPEVNDRLDTAVVLGSMLTDTSVDKPAEVEGIRDPESDKTLLRSDDASTVVADIGSELDVCPGSRMLIDESDVD